MDGHAKIGSYISTAGTKPCVTCSNVTQHVNNSRSRLLVGIGCPDPERFIYYSDEDVFAKADELRALVEA